MKLLVTNQKQIDYPKTEGSVGFDIKAKSYQIDWKNNLVIYHTGLHFNLDQKGYVLLLFPRSSIFKKQLRLTNSVGVVDEDYSGEIKFIFDLKINPCLKWLYRLGILKLNIYREGDRIGQLVIQKIYKPKIDKVTQKELENVIKSKFNSKNVRLQGGFGSTGN